MVKKFLLFLFISYSCLFAQKESYNWYFGENAGLNFNNPGAVPTPLMDGQADQLEGVATISDESGNLLFYTDGMTVWNKIHTQMTNGNGLKGNNSSTQSGVIVPHPVNHNLYYIFTVDCAENLVKSNGFEYSVVDMSQDSGLGAVIQKNQKLFTPSTEKVTSVKHANNRDVWVIAHGWNSNTFYAYLIDDHGFNSTPVVSHVGVSQGGKAENAVGYMKSSPDGTKLALSVFESGFVGLYDFDNQTGAVKNSMEIRPCPHPYGIEFSIDGTLLYVTSSDLISNVYQFNLLAGDSTSILMSKYKIAEHDSVNAFGALQLGADQRMYVASLNNYYLGVITYPDSIKKACRYIDTGLYLGGRRSFQGLPTFIQSYFDNYFVRNNSPVCEGKRLMLDCYSSKNIISYQWKGPNSFSSNIKNPIIYNATKANSGLYYVVMTDENNKKRTLITIVNVYDAPYAKISPDGDTIRICKGSPVELNAYESVGEKIKWLPSGSTNYSILANEEGKYYLISENSWGCSDTDSVYVKVENLELNLTTDKPAPYCTGDTVVIKAKVNVPGCTFLWKTGDTTQMIVVTKSGKYTVNVSFAKGCSDSATINIDFNKPPKASILASGDLSICRGDSLMLTVIPYSSDFKILWSTGESGYQIFAKDQGTYKAFISDKNGCISVDSVKVNVVDVTSSEIRPLGDSVLCKGGSITLQGFPEGNNCRYKWSTGDTSGIITAVSAGVYSLTVTVNNKCKSTCSFNLIEYSLPVVSINTTSTTICEGDSAVLTYNPEPASVWEWSTGETSSSITVRHGGTYTIKVRSKWGCADSASISLSEVPLPTPEIKTSGTGKLCSGDLLALSADTIYSSYKWSTGETTSSINVTSEGNYLLSVTNENGCSGNCKITIKKALNASINPSFADFGNQNPNTQTSKQIIVNNNTGDSVYISKAYLSKGVYFSFSSNPLVPCSLSPGEQNTFDVVFSPKLTEIEYDTLFIEQIYPCYQLGKIPLSGGGNPKIIVWVPDTTAKIGDYAFELPIYAKIDGGGMGDLPLSYQSKILIDATVFDPIFDLSDLIYPNRIITHTENNVNVSSEPSVIGKIFGKVMLGNLNKNSISISEFQISQKYETELHNGSLTITGICSQDLSRIILFLQTEALLLPNPSGSGSNLRLTSYSKGRYSIELYSVTGELIFSDTIDKTDVTPESKEIKLPSENLSSGCYPLIIKAPDRNIKMMLNVFK